MAEPWKDAFKSCMTRVMFELKLSRAMLELLCAVSLDVSWDRRAFGGMLYPDNWLATERALSKRGLIVRKPPREVREAGPPWSLTPVGEAVVQMLKVGGLYVEPETAKAQLAARRGRF